MSGDTNKGVFVTTADFDSAAIKKAHDAHHTIILINGNLIPEEVLDIGGVVLLFSPLRVLPISIR